MKVSFSFLLIMVILHELRTEIVVPCRGVLGGVIVISSY